MLNTITNPFNDNWIEVLGIKHERVSVLIVGNNPIEMTCIYDLLTGIRSKSYVADFCFSFKDSFEKIEKIRPQVILIDDNLIAKDIKEYIHVLKQNSKTSHIKMVLLKSANFGLPVTDKVDLTILKSEITANRLSSIIENSIKAPERQLA